MPWRKRLLIRIDFSAGLDGCWLWPAGSDRYGRIMRARSLVLAHRAVWEEFIGPIPNGLEMHHKCMVTMCVNPLHLEVVTHKQNMMRPDGGGRKMAEANLAKTHCPRGHPYAGDNLYYKKQGANRLCRTCSRAASRRYYWEKKAEGE